MRYSIVLASTLLALAAAVQTPAFAQDTGTPDTGAEGKAAADSAKDPAAVVATVGDATITEADLTRAEGTLDPQFAKLPAAQRRVAALSTLIDVKTLARKAREDGLNDTEDFKKSMAFLRDRALHNLYFQKNVVAPITDEEVKARYDKEMKSAPQPEQVRASHILVKTEDEAKAIIKQLDDGKDFATLAKDKSTGPSASKGGELGYFSKGQMVPAFDKAVFSLKEGEYTETPVKTQFGWHVIKVEGTRKAPPPPLEKVSDQIKQALMRERYFDVLQSARDDIDVSVKDPALKKAYDAANAQAAEATGGAN